MVGGFSTNVLFATIKGQKWVNKNGRGFSIGKGFQVDYNLILF